MMMEKEIGLIVFSNPAEGRGKKIYTYKRNSVQLVESLREKFCLANNLECNLAE